MRSALCTAGVTVLLAVGACSAGGNQSAGVSPATTSPVTPAPVPQQLPSPQELADVLVRLADPAVGGADKLALVAGATTADAAGLDSFARALRDGGYTPVTVTAADLGWSPTVPGDVSAVVTITGPRPGPADEFRFPLEFRSHGSGWQLTRETADMLLVFGP